MDGGYFPTLGVAPLLGRGITGSDALDGEPGVVVLSYGLWQRRFGGRANIVGRTARLEGRPYEVVGVMPPGLYPTWPATVGGLAFEPRYGQYWVPMQLGAFGDNRTAHVFGVVGRLKAGASLRQAQASMDTEAARLAAAYPGAYEGEGILVTRLADEVTGAVRPALVLLLAAVGLLLLIGCANLATLSLARASARARDLAVQAALGATRGRIARSLLVETDRGPDLESVRAGSSFHPGCGGGRRYRTSCHATSSSTNGLRWTLRLPVVTSSIRRPSRRSSDTLKSYKLS